MLVSLVNISTVPVVTSLLACIHFKYYFTITYSSSATQEPINSSCILLLDPSLRFGLFTVYEVAWVSFDNCADIMDGFCPWSVSTLGSLVNLVNISLNTSKCWGNGGFEKPHISPFIDLYTCIGANLTSSNLLITTIFLIQQIWYIEFYFDGSTFSSS